MTTAPKLLAPEEAARVLRESLKDPRKPLTLADAAAQSGLALRDAELGLHWLTNQYRGHLRVTNDGDLLYLFPTGFTKPWETRDALARAAAKVARGAAGVGRFVVRAWLTIVLVGYVAVFVAILIGLTFARSSSNSSSRDDLPGGLIAGVFRVLADALFWTFHPFSPLAINSQATWGTRRHRDDREDDTPFYEKVNRYFFGPTPAPTDPRAMERKILAQIRAQKGRIGLADVMRVTGLPRDQADPMMARLMLDYEGTVDVSDEGGITYTFEALRRTADAKQSAAPKPAWSEAPTVPPFTGNSTGSNVLITMLNGFNAVMALWALQANLTVDKLTHLFGKIPLADMPYEGVPMVLGVIPLLFSLALFALPLGRAAVRPIQKRKVAREKARLAVLKEVLTRVETKAPLTDAALANAWERAAGSKPSGREIAESVAALGGDVDLEAKEPGVRYRFADLETEAAALDAEREAAPEAEARVGKVVFASDR